MKTDNCVEVTYSHNLFWSIIYNIVKIISVKYGKIDNFLNS